MDRYASLTLVWCPARVQLPAKAGLLIRIYKGGDSMAQYCRYCIYFVTGNGNYCEMKHTEPSDEQAKRTNRCKDFDLNPIDAFGENEAGYRPRVRKQKTYSQVRMDI